ncbi:RNA polymerase sigma factor [Mucilaginibacter auburnensis]|uniref:RNA polymerase sigma-70 factor (ECF subfamily) n=1 Tax=Mucilaginibacter auburnensis TaxID=1457233 RepID=A0A2H9VT79_9SPHI|nr:RNA polymerase sigma factor [Mucilaginibacter auburnensis]PJJ84009.1 RNA polymerase sigma-70 factor (ECF subfamily) [Mucilaginibacter auburnensis]
MTTSNTNSRLEQLWKGCLQNNRKDQEVFYKMLAPKMLALCMRYAKDRDTAQDILQDGFVKIFKNANNYRGEGSLEGWVRSIMVHSAISYYRKAKKTVLIEDFAETGLAIGTSHNANKLETTELNNLIDQLPENYRYVFSMHALEGYSHREISDKLNISELLSRTNLSRARSILKNKLNTLNNINRYSMAG